MFNPTSSTIPVDPTAILVELLTGVFLLLYGVRLVSDALQRVISGRIQQAVTKLANYPLATFGIGIIGTALMQSSVAVASLLVEMVSAGLLPLGVTIVMMLGANVGATLVVQLLALRITDYALVLLGLGVAAALLTHRTSFRPVGRALFGFALIVLGLAAIGIAGQSFASGPVTKDILQSLAGAPIVLVVIGALLAMLLNSSTAAIGLVIALAAQNALSPASALVLMLGSNVGTTLLTMLASLGQGILAGRRLALVHCGTKLLGAVIFLILAGPVSAMLSQIWSNAGTQVALAHMGFNLALAIVFVPFSDPLARMMERLLPDKINQTEEPSPRVLDPRALATPAVAHGLATREMLRMADIVTHMFEMGMRAFEQPETIQEPIDAIDERNDISMPAIRTFGKQPDTAQKRIETMDDQLDELNASIKGYLTQLDEEEMTEEQVRKDITLFTIVGDLEAIGDVISHRFTRLARRRLRGQIQFSEEGWEDLLRYHHQIEEGLQQVLAALAGQNPALVTQFLERKPELKRMKRDLHLRHIRELRAGITNSTTSSAIYLDMLDALSAVLSHISNIAYALQEASSLRFYSSFRSLRTGQLVQVKPGSTSQQLYAVPRADFTQTGSLASTGALHSVETGQSTQMAFTNSQQLYATGLGDQGQATGALASTGALHSVETGQSTQMAFTNSQQLYATGLGGQGQATGSLASTGALHSVETGQSTQINGTNSQRLCTARQAGQVPETGSLLFTNSLRSVRPVPYAPIDRQ